MAEYAPQEEAPVAPDIRDFIAAQAKEQVEACQRFKQSRIKDWKENEDLYIGKTRPAMRGRFNVPLPVMSGFIDTLLAEINENPSVIFDKTKNSDPMRAKKVTSAWEIDSDTQHANWKRVLADGRKVAAIYGLMPVFIYSESDPSYKHHLDLIDPYDFIFEPTGGAFLENHQFCGIDNMYRSKSGMQSEYYDKGQVAKLIARFEQGDIVDRHQDNMANKANRFAALGLDGTFRGYKGDCVYRNAMVFTTYKGTRYAITVNMDTGIWLKCEELKDMYASGLWPIVVSHPYRDPFNMLSKAPADDVRPTAKTAQIILNQTLENRQKMNWGMTAFDQTIFPDPSQLEYRPSGLVATIAAEKGVNIQNGIYEFKTPEITGSINLLNYIDQFVGQKTGITASAQGATDKDAKVGVYFGDLKQVAKRMTLQSDSFSEMLEQLALRYSWCLWEHMPESYAVKVLGEEGANWVTMTREDANPDFGIRVVGGMLETQNNELEVERKVKTIAGILADPLLSTTLSPRWASEQMLTAAGFKADEIRRAQDVKANASSENDIANASQAIEDILLGKQPKKYTSATQNFLQKIVDYYSNNEMKPKHASALFAYFQQMMPIVADNVARKALMEGRQQAQQIENAQMMEGTADMSSGMAPAPAPTQAPAPMTSPAPITPLTGQQST